MLNLEALPVRIECFDISNLGEQATVASMVVFEQGMPKKADYRMFGIGARAGPGRLRVDVRGRARAGSRGSRTPSRPTTATTPAFAAVPNLVVIDGGKGQLSAALGALDGLDLPRVAAIGLAKRIEEVFVPGRADADRAADDDSPALLLLRRIRDEAHRFALKHHRRRRAKASGTDSLFDALPGVGPARKQALLRALRLARRRCSTPTADELEAVPGLPRKTAREIYAFLHRTGGAATARDGALRRSSTRRPAGASARSSTATTCRSTTSCRGDDRPCGRLGAAARRRSASSVDRLRRVLRRRARHVRRPRPRADAGAGRRHAVRGAPACASCGGCRTARRSPTASSPSAPAGTAPRARRVRLRARHALDRRPVPPRDRADGSIGELRAATAAYKRRLLRLEGLTCEAAPRIVCLGGGTGLSSCCAG